MSNEITITVNGSVQWTTSNFKDSFRPGTKKYDQSNPGSAGGTVSLTSDSTTIPLDAVLATAGWAFFSNVTTAMDILIGPTSDSYLLRLPPESDHVVHLTSNTTLCAQTTANSAVLQYLILQV